MQPSIQYQISNVVLADDVLCHSHAFFPQVLLSGKLLLYLAYRWYDMIEIGKQRNINFIDIDRQITPDDFKYQVFVLETNFLAAIVEFPECDLQDASGKYGLIISSSYMPVSYFTLEYGRNIFTNETMFYVGRWKVVSKDGSKEHLNYGPVQSKEEFIRLVFNVLQEENPDHNINNLVDQILHPENLIPVEPKQD